MLKDKAGHKLYRKVVITVYFPEKIFPPRKMVQHAPAHSGFHSDGIDAMLEAVADQLDTLYPFWDFKIVPLAPEGRTAKFSIVFAGYRVSPQNTQLPEAAEVEPTITTPGVVDIEQTEISAASEAGAQ